MEKFHGDSVLISWFVGRKMEMKWTKEMDVLVECHNVYLSLVEQKLECGQMF